MLDAKNQLADINRLFSIGLREKAVEKFLDFLKADVEIDVSLLEEFEFFLDDLEDKDISLLDKCIDFYFEETDLFYYGKIALLRRLHDRVNLIEYPLTYNRKNKNKKRKHYIEKCIIRGLENRFDAALEIINQALIEEPRNLEYKRVKVKILMALGEKRLAIKYIDENSNEVGENPDFLALKAEIFYHLERFDDALEVIEKAISLADRKVSLYKTKANIYLGKNDPDSAIKAIDDAIRRFSSDKGLIFFKAGILEYNMNDSEGALKLIDQHFSADENDWLFYNTKANLLLDLKKSDAALKTIDKGLDIFKNNHIFLMQKVEIYRQMREYKSALETTNTIFALYGKYININNYKKKITILINLNEYDKALELAKEAITKYGKQIDLLLLETEILNDTEEYIKALSVIDDALKLDPGNRDALVQKCISLGYSDDPNYALSILEDLSIRYKGDLEISLIKQLMYYFKEEFHRSNQILSDALSQEIDDRQKAFCYYLKSVNYLSLNDLNQSLKMIDNALTIDDTREHEYLYLAQKIIVLLEKEKYSLAYRMMNDFYHKSDSVDEFYGVLLEIFKHANNVFKKDVMKAKETYSFLDRIDFVVSPDKELLDLTRALRNNLIACEVNGEIITFKKAERNVFFPKIKSFIKARDGQEANRPPSGIINI